MNYRVWKQWLMALPWSLKWFPIIVILRPIIDNFYFLKEVSPLLSPLYIAGVLTFILSLNTIYRRKLYGKNTNDRFFYLWTFLGIMSALLIVFKYGITDLVGWQLFLKLLLPFYLYFFCRRLIRTKMDFINILQTFFYSSVIAAVILLYEIIFNPIRLEYTRDSIERIQGNFADVINYALYIVFGFVIYSYFYLQIGWKSMKINFRWLVVLIICVTGLFKINHATSFVTFVVLFIIFLLFIVVRNVGLAAFFSLVIAILFINVGSVIYEDKILPLVGKDIEIIRNRDSDGQEGLFHGRMGRWEDVIEVFKNSSYLSKLLGYPYSFRPSGFYVSGVHNDFLRVLMFTGLAGLVIYLGILFKNISRFRYHKTYDQYLIMSCITALILYSITTVPTYYNNILYIIIPTFIYIGMPLNMKYVN